MWFVNALKTGMLFILLIGLMVGAGYLIGGVHGMAIGLMFAAVSNMVMFFFSDKIALATMGAKEVAPDDELYKITEELAQRAGIPTPRVYISEHEAPNAFATGRGPSHSAVCVTRGLLRILNRNEITGVIGHELAHVLHRDILTQTLASIVAGAIGFLSHMAFFMGGRNNDDEDSNPLAAILLMIFGPLAAGLIQMAISRSREYAADATGAQICGNPQYLASALNKLEMAAHQIPMQTNPAFHSMFIVEPRGMMDKVAGMFMTHPPVEKRIEALNAMRI